MRRVRAKGAAPDAKVIEAVQWRGDLDVLKPWFAVLPSLPIYLAPLPAITLMPDTLVPPNDWLLRDGTSITHCSNADFSVQFEVVSAFDVLQVLRDGIEHAVEQEKGVFTINGHETLGLYVESLRTLFNMARNRQKCCGCGKVFERHDIASRVGGDFGDRWVHRDCAF